MFFVILGYDIKMEGIESFAATIDDDMDTSGICMGELNEVFIRENNEDKDIEEWFDVKVEENVDREYHIFEAFKLEDNIDNEDFNKESVKLEENIKQLWKTWKDKRAKVVEFLKEKDDILEKIMEVNKKLLEIKMKIFNQDCLKFQNQSQGNSILDSTFVNIGFRTQKKCIQGSYVIPWPVLLVK